MRCLCSLSALALVACAPPPSAVPRAPQAVVAPAPGASPPSIVVADLTVDVPLDPALAYQAFTGEIDRFWDHHFSEKPYLLRLDARPGGSFVELFDGEGNGAEHARVIYANAGKELRMVGPLGLSGKGIEMVHTLSFAPGEQGGARVTLHIERIGQLLPEEREAVTQVWRHFLDRFREYATKREAKRARPSFLQRPVVAPEKVGLGFFSHGSRGKARNHVHADDFALESAARLVGLRFWGHVEGRVTYDVANISDFAVRIHAATPDGAPGPVVQEQFFSLAKTHPEPTGRSVTLPGKKSGAVEYRHEITFASPLALAPKQAYFVSIAAFRKDPDGEAWQWSDAELRNARSYSHPLDDPAWKAIDDTDSAFELIVAD